MGLEARLPPYHFPYLVSVRRCVERLNHCRCALSTRAVAPSFSDQHSVWLMCKVPAFSWEVFASRLNGGFEGKGTLLDSDCMFVDLWIPI